MRAPGRRGIALPVALVTLVTLGLLTTALLLLASHETRIAYARLDAIRARYAAESAAREALARWRTDRHRDLAVGAREALPGASGALSPRVRYEASVERLGRRTYLVRALGRVPRVEADGGVGVGGARVRAGVLVRTVDPIDLWSAFAAALTVGGETGLLDGARVDAAAPHAVPPGWPAGVCDAARADHAGVSDGSPPAGVRVPDPKLLTVSPGATIAGDPPVAVETAPDGEPGPAGVGPLDAATLAAVADRRPTGRVELRPPDPGDCDAGSPGAWGDPFDPTGPCGDSFPLIVANGDLEVVRGGGQGVLIVAGDLTLGPGVRFYGPMVVGGDLRVAADAEVHGAVRTGRAAHASSIGGTIIYSACALGRALRASPALDGPFRPSGRWWVPLF